MHDLSGIKLAAVQEKTTVSALSEDKQNLLPALGRLGMADCTLWHYWVDFAIMQKCILGIFVTLSGFQMLLLVFFFPPDAGQLDVGH